MPEKLTLAIYLERRGAVKALTRIEAEVFGVPYPLVKGWAHRHGAGEITQAMLDQLQEKIGRAKSSTAEKAQRGLDGVERLPLAAQTAQMPGCVTPNVEPQRVSVENFPNFILRFPRRHTSPYRTLSQKRTQG